MIVVFLTLFTYKSLPVNFIGSTSSLSTVLGIAGLWLAILADTGATLLVIMNSLRLLAGNGAEESAKA